MPSDKPGLVIRRLLLELLTAHGETEVHRSPVQIPIDRGIGEAVASAAAANVNVSEGTDSGASALPPKRPSIETTVGA